MSGFVLGYVLGVVTGVVLCVWIMVWMVRAALAQGRRLRDQEQADIVAQIQSAVVRDHERRQREVEH